jgi:hypothetical protein
MAVLKHTYMIFVESYKKYLIYYFHSNRSDFIGYNTSNTLLH